MRGRGGLVRRHRPSVKRERSGLEFHLTSRVAFTRSEAECLGNQIEHELASLKSQSSWSFAGRAAGWAHCPSSLSLPSSKTPLPPAGSSGLCGPGSRRGSYISWKYRQQFPVASSVFHVELSSRKTLNTSRIRASVRGGANTEKYCHFLMNTVRCAKYSASSKDVPAENLYSRLQGNSKVTSYPSTPVLLYLWPAAWVGEHSHEPRPKWARTKFPWRPVFCINLRLKKLWSGHRASVKISLEVGAWSEKNPLSEVESSKMIRWT